MMSFSATLTACSNSSSSAKEESTTQQTAKTRDLPEGDYKEFGDGKVYVSTDAGSSEDIENPVLYVDKDEDILIQIGFEAWDYDGSHLSFIYIDGMLNTKEQLGDVQMSLDLEGDALTEGIHVVEVVQYEDDDPTKEMTSYHKTSYLVKYK